jgi:2-polyprenyl-6-methoxyphenol hydroxylase-like FAD-dependent oxidoreductase
MPGKGILAHREINGALHTYLALNKPEDWIHRIDFSDPATALAHVAEEFDDWAPELAALIIDGETAPVPRTIHAPPVEHRWDRVHGVTVIGDAANLMSPFAGEGANLAMYDCAELGEAIAANPGDIEAALLEYEKVLFPRSASAAAEADPEPQALLRRQCASKSTRPVHQLSVREVIAQQGAQEDLMEGALDERKMATQLGRLVFLPVLVNPKALDFRFESRPWNPEFGSRA